MSGPGQKACMSLRAAGGTSRRRSWLEHRVVGDGPCDVHDDGIPRRALLGLEDARDRSCVEGVCAEAVDGLGGQGDELAATQQVSGPGNCLARIGVIEMAGIYRQAQGLHLSIVARRLTYTHFYLWRSRRRSSFASMT